MDNKVGMLKERGSDSEIIIKVLGKTDKALNISKKMTFSIML